MQSKVNCIFIIILVTILKSNARRRQPKFSVVVIQLCLISKIKKFANIKKKKKRFKNKRSIKLVRTKHSF